MNYYPGAEARVRQAMLYKKLGDKARASELFAALLKDARLAPKHFRRSEREWIELAERESARERYSSAKLICGNAINSSVTASVISTNGNAPRKIVASVIVGSFMLALMT